MIGDVSPKLTEAADALRAKYSGKPQCAVSEREGARGGGREGELERGSEGEKEPLHSKPEPLHKKNEPGKNRNPETQPPTPKHYTHNLDPKT